MKNQTYKLPLQLALTGGFGLGCTPRAVVQAHVQVVVRRDALAEVGGPSAEVGKGRLGAWAGLGAPSMIRLIFTLHVILQTPQLPCKIKGNTKANDWIEKGKKGKDEE